MSFPEALQTLARQAGIALTQRRGDGQRAAERQRLVGVMRRAVEFYTDRLLSGPDAGPARAYLRSRGYDRSIVEKFGLGFSPQRPPLLLTELRSAGFSDRDMERAGLVIRGDGGYRDRFWDRIMFPIHDLRGEPVGFGARAMGDRNPKYLNSPETPVYRKSRLLYGLHLARRGDQPGRAGGGGGGIHRRDRHAPGGTGGGGGHLRDRPGRRPPGDPGQAGEEDRPGVRRRPGRGRGGAERRGGQPPKRSPTQLAGGQAARRKGPRRPDAGWPGG